MIFYDDINYCYTLWAADYWKFHRNLSRGSRVITRPTSKLMEIYKRHQLFLLLNIRRDDHSHLIFTVYWNVSQIRTLGIKREKICAMYPFLKRSLGQEIAVLARVFISIAMWSKLANWLTSCMWHANTTGERPQRLQIPFHLMSNSYYTLRRVPKLWTWFQRGLISLICNIYRV